MKKPFKETKIGKLLKGGAKSLIPIVGDVIENKDSKDGGEGRFYAPKSVRDILRYLVFAVVFYQFIKGEVSIEDVKMIVP